MCGCGCVCGCVYAYTDTSKHYSPNTFLNIYLHVVVSRQCYIKGRIIKSWQNHRLSFITIIVLALQITLPQEIIIIKLSEGDG